MRSHFRVSFLATLTVLCVFQLVPAQQRGRRGQGNQDQANPSGAQPQPPAQPQPRGIQPKVFAITGARVIPEPGKAMDKATVVIRNGLIEAVGPDIAAPPDAIKIDGEGMTVYPGFVDAVSHWGFDNALRRSESGPSVAEDFASEALAVTKADNRRGLTPEFVVNTAFVVDEDQSNSWRAAGFTSHLVAPEGGIFTGQSAVVSLNGAAPRDAILNSPVAMHAALRSPQGAGDYPRSLMGVVAHARQTLLDAGHYQRQHAAFERRGRVGLRPPLDPALAALGPVLEGKQPIVFEADTRDAIHRTLDIAAEFKLKPILFGGRDAWKVAERLKQEDVPVLLRVSFNEPNDEAEKALPQKAREERKRLRQEEAENAARLHKAGVRIALATGGQPVDRFLGNLRKMIAAGLPVDAALTALTTEPARIWGVEGQVGKIEAGRPAHVVVMRGDLKDDRSQVRMVFADGWRFENTPGTGGRGGAAAGRAGGGGRGGFARGQGQPPGDRGRQGGANPPAAGEGQTNPETTPATPGEYATEIEADRKPSTQTGGNVLVRGATVLTAADAGTTTADLLVRAGKIAAIGPNLSADGSTVIDAAGMFVMPGIIDTHSHFAIDGGVNEMSLSVVPEVRVRDVVDGDDVQIYRALAGGVTTARLLHGSANCVGGQDAVIKLKYGKPGRELIVTDGPRGVKFALGENVKRTDGRFPNSRLGVEAVYVRAFTEAQEYQKTWDECQAAKKAGKDVPEPRRDLRLEALADILKGDIKVHCHCYRADEILMLLRVADRFGFKIKSLQHVLEGYKIAPEIAAHGASVSLFTDWWAYKIEAFDAIPFGAALLHEAGASVCLKSDSNELMRHLYQEAAKCIKYGGMSEADALRTITLNPAKQLGLEKRIGTIEIGKDADLAIFNGHPLNSYSRVEMTLVEGEVYFQRTPKMSPDRVAVAGPAQPRMGAIKLPQNGNGPIAIRGATVHPVSGPAMPNATVVIEQGRIRAVGQNGAAPIPAGATIIPAEGLHLFPGMIDAGTVLGLAEVGSARETNDYGQTGDFQPDLRASVAINPDSELIPVTRANGVTTVVTRPTGGVIAGQGALINLAGWVPREMTVVDQLGLFVEFPSSSPFASGDFGPSPFGGRGVATRQRGDRLKQLKDLFAQAVAYDEGRKQSSKMPANPRLEALVPYARGQKLVVMQANRRQEIIDALKLADDLKIKVVLSGAIEAWKAADELKKRDVPVIVGPIMALPQDREFDRYDAPFINPAKLKEAGVRFCIRTNSTGGGNSGGSNTRNLPYEAAFAVSYGLPAEEGLRSVTLYPAQILGVADQLGTIESGKRANLVLATGDVLQASTPVEAIFIDGKPLEPTSKQTRLYERYRERLKEVKEGKAPLGTGTN
jgi:imidazolonepropionase-like amidohydrolase